LWDIVTGQASLGNYLLGPVPTDGGGGYVLYQKCADGEWEWIVYGPQATLAEAGYYSGIANHTDRITAARAWARTINTPMLLVGAFIASWSSLAPNYYYHSAHGHSTTEVATDLIVDTAGLFTVDLSALAVGNMITGGVGAIGGEMGASLFGSMLWDSKIAPALRVFVRSFFD
jgi:hypothetical protein